MKRFIFTLTLMVALMSAQAQILYKISGRGLTAPSYIVGTYHLAPVSFVDSIPGIRQVMADCQQVYGELVMADLLGSDSLAQIQLAMLLPEGMTLDNLLDTDEMGRLNAYMKQLIGFDMTNPMIAQQMSRMTPSALSTTLSALSYMKKSGSINLQNTFDDYFQRQKELLMCLVDHADFMDEMAENVVRAFFAQDLDAIQKAMEAKLNNSCDNTPEEDAEILDKRNADWLTKMPAIMAEKPTLFAVGAAHLYGEQGVLHLLRTAGYTVEGVTK